MTTPIPDAARENVETTAAPDAPIAATSLGAAETQDRMGAVPPRPETEAGRRLIAELSESPLPGARYAANVVRVRLAAIEREAAEFDLDRLATAIDNVTYANRSAFVGSRIMARYLMDEYAALGSLS